MNVQENIRILEEEIIKLSTERMTPSLAQSLNTYFGAKMALEGLLNNSSKSVLNIQNKPTHEDIGFVAVEKELFPTLIEFNQNHTEHNLKKLCLEIQEFCISVYSTLQNEEEKNIYRYMAKNLTTF